jgi:hypothetical protein
VRKVLFAAVAAGIIAAPILVFAFAPAPDAGSRTVEHKTYAGYAESRDSGQKGDASFLVIPSKTEFTRIFDPVLTPRGAPDPVAKDAFDTRLFVAVIKRDDVLWDYKVEKVTANGDALTVNYRATPRKGGDAPRGETRRAGPLVTTTKESPKDTQPAARATEKKADSTERARTSSATFDSPLILSVPKDKYLTVVFMENGRKVGTARVGN